MAITPSNKVTQKIKPKKTVGNLSTPQFKQQVMPKSMYVNVAMQMTPESTATNTASGTKA
jgi:hypothetical protein